LEALQGSAKLLINEHEAKLRQEVGKLMDEEVLKWKQQAKEEWLKCGDRNIKFFIHVQRNDTKKTRLSLSVMRMIDYVTHRRVLEGFLKPFHNGDSW
jgi:hypothetical protein